MKIRVVDLETTGLIEDDPKVCEIGWTDYLPDMNYVTATTSWLVNPGIPIPPQAQAIHHISDRDIAEGEAFSQSIYKDELIHGMEPGDILAAHNASFEKHFLGDLPHDWICTYKCAYHLWHDAPSHGNQVLRYWLGFDLAEDQAMPPHRAGPDTYVTAWILGYLHKEMTIEEMIRVSARPLLLRKVPFGVHYGKAFGQCPISYLDWIVNKSDMPRDPNKEDIVYTAREHLAKRA